MVFPTLFTITDVVLANHSGIMSVIENDLQVFTAKLKYLVNFAENKKRRNSLSICWKLRIWSHLLKKSLMENFIFCAVY